MCILFIYTNPNPPENGFRLVLAANRDEVFHRPTRDVHRWDEDQNVIGGRDMEKGREGGTWLALSLRSADSSWGLRVASLLNITGEARLAKGKGRGFLVTNYVLGTQNACDYLKEIEKHGSEYSAFNFVAVEIGKNKAETYHYSNVDNSVVSKCEGDVLRGFGNSLPTVSLSKVHFGKSKFAEIIQKLGTVEKKDQLAAELMKLLKHDERHLPDPELKKRAPDWHEHLSSIFVNIKHASYGTRTHTIITVDAEGKVEYIEDTMDSPVDVENPGWHKQVLHANL